MAERNAQQSRALVSKEAFSAEAEEIFLSAMDIAGEPERHAFVESACARNPLLKEAVESMLRAQADVDEFFQEIEQATGIGREPNAAKGVNGHGSHAPRIPQETPGTCIGPYKLLQVIGEGGCGVVYMAEQEKPVRRRVALKIIKLGLDTKSVIARFDAERQALALMDHPNIARVLDAGATETGRPYFVMELVRGMKLTAYCDQNRLDTTQRLHLFIQVCHAIQHAHQKGVIHRDIKPSNVLVTMHDDVPVPMVIDFGIAKAVEGRLTDQTLYTPYEQFIGTPAYMSPEQAERKQLDVDTRSDIYSLGVLLYELLTGRTPFDGKKLAELGPDEMRRMLREREPLSPAAAVTALTNDERTQTARARGIEPTRMISVLKGDLGWIVMKALEKDRTRRYQTANGFAMDVQRFLAQEPILARPPSRWYRFQKMVRRNKVVFASSAAVALALTGGMGISVCLLIRARDAEREEARLRKIAEHGMEMETVLRHQIERRAKISQAGMLIAQGDVPGADQVVAEIPLDQPTMEGAEVFRVLGEWNALRGRWRAAKDRFHLLRRAEIGSMPSNVSLDWTEEAVAIVECNEVEEYDRFCNDSLKTFQNTHDSLVADRAMRNCLLMPAPAARIASLQPMAACARKPMEGVDLTNSRPQIPTWQIPWRYLNLALWEFRSGNPTEAMVWCRRCLESPDHLPAREASAQAIMALCLQQTGNSEEGLALVEQARHVVEAKFQNPLTVASSDGAWFDWEVSRILLREATAKLEDASFNTDWTAQSGEY